MAEIKNNFQGGKMNKDLDERLVPQGEYRDALNIEVRTSGDSDVGVLQNLYGNHPRMHESKYGVIDATVSWNGIESYHVGSIANEKTNKAYFFIAGPTEVGRKIFDPTLITHKKVWKDMIVEYDNVTRLVSPVVNDVFRVDFTKTLLGTISNAPNETSPTNYITLGGTNGIAAGKLLRKGMSIQFYDPVGGSLIRTYEQTEGHVSDNGYGFFPKIFKIEESSTGCTIYFDRYIWANYGFDQMSTCVCQIDKTLGFSNSRGGGKNLITGINIIDDLLFWTDNYGEPKKINITRSKEGVDDFMHHTSLMVQDPDQINPDSLKRLDLVDAGSEKGLREEHVTVIRRAPKTSPKLQMSTSRSGQNNTPLEADLVQHSAIPSDEEAADHPHWATTEFMSSESPGSPSEAGNTYDVLIQPGISFNVGSQVKLESGDVGNEIKTIRAKIIDHRGSPWYGTFYRIEIESIDSTITSSNINWRMSLYSREEDPYFQLKFGRFSFRYKYQDGEYSSFAPWSELAFLPGGFDYIPKKGYNLGMVNNVRNLKVTDFIVDDALRPDDVVEVDILYKDTVSPNVYIVKSIKRSRDHEWTTSGEGSYSGVLNITSELIHKTLESSQILRAWDNVPRKALAQEVTGNRIVYGNYLQNYNVNSKVFVEQGFTSITHPGNLDEGMNDYRIPDPEQEENLPVGDWKDDPDYLMPKKSLKSIRKYRVGVVFGDKYGRETPVLGLGGAVSRGSGKPYTEVYDDSVNVDKDFCANVNKLTAKLNWKGGQPEDWMEYYKFYVKEPSNEYYNLVQVRWYNAEDGNIWLSFQSADRNKVDIETYLILKNEHGSQKAVLEKARYKILAIENEAPDFIKTTDKVIGEQKILSISSLQTSTTLLFDADDYNDSFKDHEFKGVGYARIKAIEGTSVKYSRWVKVSRMNDSTHQVSLVKPFGESANLLSIFEVDNLADLDFIKLEIKDAVVENRPEFDGVFFVKVYKDATLSRTVLAETQDFMDYQTVENLPFGYVSGGHGATNISNVDDGLQSRTYRGDFSGISDPQPGSAATQGGTDYTGVRWTHGNGLNASDADNMALCSKRGDTEDFWKWYHAASVTRGAPFIDSARGASSGGDTSSVPADHRGIYYASNRNEVGSNGGYNAIQWGAIGYTAFHDNGPRQAFLEHMTEPGTMFRFTGDPFQQIYVITGSLYGDGTKSSRRNYHRKDPECRYCNKKEDPGPGWGFCLRTRFFTYFHKLGDTTQGMDNTKWDPRSTLLHDGSRAGTIEIVESNFVRPEGVKFTTGNAIWETEPKEDLNMDLYYEATDAIPIRLDNNNIQSFIPLGSIVEIIRNGNLLSNAYTLAVDKAFRDVVGIRRSLDGQLIDQGIEVGDTLRFNWPDGTTTQSEVIAHWSPLTSYYDTDYKPADWEEDARAASTPTSTTHGDKDRLGTGYYRIDYNTWNKPVTLDWFNCYSFGNGLESDRIRDDFNTPTIDNGCKVSSVIDVYGEERRASGMIWSGIYNSTSGINRLNEFNMAGSITKDLNPSYGSLQALKTRDTNVVAFCEDKVFKILANKDSLYNADGSKNVTASNAVLGDAIGFVGDYGISSNPESLAMDSYRMYFTDKQRNKVLRLSQDGLTPISDVGMISWFRDNLGTAKYLVGSFDEIKGEYNLSLIRNTVGLQDLNSLATNDIEDITVSFSEKTKGWSSFKSFIPQVGISINDEYLTGKILQLPEESNNDKVIWSHHIEHPSVDANSFYGTWYPSTVDVLFNQNPEMVKSFSAMNYEGSQAKVDGYESKDTVTDVNNNLIQVINDQHRRLSAQDGWYVSSFSTDMQEASVLDFVKKENKWFNHIKGVARNLSNIDTREFSTQGVGLIDIVSTPIVRTFTLTVTENAE